MGIVLRAKQALWRSYTSQTNFKIDSRGYVDDPEMNLLPGVTIDLFEADFLKGSGNELQNKFLATHSSSVLAVNSFAIWKKQLPILSLCGATGFTEMQFEKKCPTGLGGIPPNLDVFLENESTVIGIESKFLETLKPKKARFAPSYNLRNLPQVESQWWKLLQEVSKGDPQHLDVAQLIKHYLGLRKQYRDKKDIILLYVFWEPENASEFAEFRKHREELKWFQSRVSGSSVTFVAKSYPELWREWDQLENIEKHLKNLRRRYCVKL